MTSQLTRWALAVVLGAGMLFGGEAAAQLRLAAVSAFGTQQTFTVNDAVEPLIIGTPNQTELSVSVPAGQAMVVVFFSAECRIEGDEDESRVEVKLRVDGDPIAPTGGNLVFCRGNLANQGAYAIHGARLVEAGTHAITAVAVPRALDGGESVRIDDISILVLVQPTSPLQ